MSLLGIIGGTGLSSLQDFAVERSIDGETPYGATSAPLTCGRLQNSPLIFLPRHGAQHSIAPHRINYRANLWSLKEAGVDELLTVNAVGGISQRCASGDLVIPDDLIDYTWGREQTFCDGVDKPLRHVEFCPPYDDSIRQRLLTAAERADVTVVAGAVMGVTQGPRLETGAEITRLARDGCDIVGMTAMPEIALARELGIPCASCAIVVNPAAGTAPGSILEQIEANLDLGTQRFYRVLGEFVRNEGS